jgi:hypothetical protein
MNLKYENNRDNAEEAPIAVPQIRRSKHFLARYLRAKARTNARWKKRGAKLKHWHIQ